MANENSGCAALLIVAIVAAVGGYDYLNEHGWISHDKESSITAQANWIPGESKDCASYPLDEQTATSLHLEAGYVMQNVTCDDGPSHRMSVRFFGRVTQPEYSVAHWKCIRREQSFDCYQTGGDSIRRTVAPVAPEATTKPCSPGATQPYGDSRLVCTDSGTWELSIGALQRVGDKTYRWDGHRWVLQ